MRYDLYKNDLSVNEEIILIYIQNNCLLLKDWNKKEK